ncbi:MAG: SH3 domain-containing protein [Planctomycetes bacterium]|nr:SH3 domain-containing protein [Planctomycetota bacterium]
MRKRVVGLILALTVLATAAGANAGEFEFGDLPPLPPPLTDDADDMSLSPPESVALSPLIQPSASPVSAPAAPGLLPPPPPGGPPPPVAESPARSPLVPPAVPPLAPPPPAAEGSALVPAAPPLAPPPVSGSPAPASPLPADIDSADAATAVAPAEPEVPRPAKITGGRVNVRAGPHTQYESIAVLTTGMPVTVLAKNGDWYKIVYPADQLASIHKNFVEADITGEIPEVGLPGIVNQDDTDVHAFYWDKSTIVGKLNKGDPVVIKQERGQWYRIAAPESARAYVFAEYVRVDGGEPVVADSQPPPVNPAVDLDAGRPDAAGKPALSADDKRALEIKEAYVRRERENFVRMQEEEERSVSQLEEALDDLEARLRAIDEEIASQFYYPSATTSIGSAAWAPPDPVYGGYTGWVENIGRVGAAPASFRLSKGGEIRFYLRSDRYSLQDFAGRRVWVNGAIESASGAIANVLNVDQIRILTDLEIAEGLRQQQEATGQAMVPTGQPSLSAANDPYYDYYDGDSGPQPYLPMGYESYNSDPVVPSDPSDLPDVVGYNQTVPSGAGTVIMSTPGEVDSDFYQPPFVSEVGP